MPQRPVGLAVPTRRSGGRPGGLERRPPRWPTPLECSSGLSPADDNWHPAIPWWRCRPHDAEIRCPTNHLISHSLFKDRVRCAKSSMFACAAGGRMRRAAATPRPATAGRALKDMVMISERPAEVGDRAVPGHWEGDLIFGKKMTATRPWSSVTAATSCRASCPTETEPKPCALPWPKDPHLARHSATLADLGPGQGDGRTRALQRRDRCGGLLLRSQEPWQRGHQREHQRTVAPIPPENNDLSLYSQHQLNTVARSLNQHVSVVISSQTARLRCSRNY